MRDTGFMVPDRADIAIVDIGGLPVAYREAGDGPPVVLLHGAWSDGREWRLQLEGLADEFRLIAWDAPGCGASGDPPADFTLDDYADTAAALVAALGLEPAHVVGLSFGGGLAIALAARHPTAVQSLVLASAYAGWKGSLPADEVAARVARVVEEADEPPEEWAASYLPGFFAGPVDPVLVDEVLAIMCDSRPAGIKAMVRAFGDADLRDALPRLTVPTLLLYGDQDTRAPLSVARALHDAIPDAELRVLPGVGHVSSVEAPDRFNDEVRCFLRSVRS
jgi:pimeloyl-ACP methyl ester carboxylesterase